MPVKIQELVIQTKIKPDNGFADNSASLKAIQQDLMKLEKRIEYSYLQAMNSLLREKQER